MAGDAEDWISNANEIVTSMQESNPVDDEMNEDEDNESSKGPSNADLFSVLETAMKWYKQQSRVLSYSTTAAQENHETLQQKTKVYNGTAKN
ncbi:hypothetical protein TNCV_4008261 [Trichonephila clavipes]|nr:hypothetical protein TNCV_4008261 [Trichonephila clavipes]